MPQDQIIACWKQITAPVLMINATDGYDHRIGQDGTDMHFSNGRLVQIGDAGHWVHHDQLDQVVDTIGSFLQV
jgi:pimeloyl-ACP methyl ester carboxylesterase